MYETTSAPTADRAPGSFYTSDDSGSHEQSCIYMNCEAFVRPSAARFSFELVIVNTEDDRNGGENDESTSDPNHVSPSMYFPIDKSARFESDGDRFGWCDRSGKRYHLDVDGEVFSSILRRAISVALFQKIHSALPGPDDQEEVETLLTCPPEPSLDDLLASRGELLRVNGELFKYNDIEERFDSACEDVILSISSAIIRDDGRRIYLMIFYHPQSGQQIMQVEISNSLNAQCVSETLSIVWTMEGQSDENEGNVDANGDPYNIICLSFCVQDEEQFLRFRSQFSLCQYEVTNNAAVEDLKLKDGDLQFIEDSLRDDVDPMEVDSDSGYETPEEQVKENERRVTDVGGRASLGREDDGMVNSHLAVAANHDRTFVVRGNRMGVFQTGEEGPELNTTIQFKDPNDGRSFTPSKVLLNRMDRSMLLLDPSDDTKIMRMDLERGEIVDTWKGGLTKNTPVKTIHQSQKYSILTDEQDFVGVNRNQLLRMDPRTSEFVVQSKNYAAGTRARLECMATTGMGYLAVASENGDIRLFDQIGKNAKTHLPGLGDPIIGIDVTEDGYFILATTAKYILLIDTRVKGQAKGGFLKSMGKDKPAPRKLTISNTDIVKHRMGQVNFTTAHFNTGSSLERSIVTSTGPFVVLWNFRQVKLGHLDKYIIKRYTDKVVADNFKYNDDGRIVVTLPNDVSIAKR